MSEHDEQSALVAWARLNERRYPELVMLFAVPLGGYRAKKTAARMKKEGAKPGVPDLCLPVARGGFHSLWVEMKFGKGRLTKAQKWWCAKLRAEGHRVEVCRSWEAARDVLLDYLDVKSSEF